MAKQRGLRIFNVKGQGHRLDMIKNLVYNLEGTFPSNLDHTCFSCYKWEDKEPSWFSRSKVKMLNLCIYIFWEKGLDYMLLDSIKDCGMQSSIRWLWQLFLMESWPNFKHIFFMARRRTPLIFKVKSQVQILVYSLEDIFSRILTKLHIFPSDFQGHRSKVKFTDEKFLKSLYTNQRIHWFSCHAMGCCALCCPDFINFPMPIVK